MNEQGGVAGGSDGLTTMTTSRALRYAWISVGTKRRKRHLSDRLRGTASALDAADYKDPRFGTENATVTRKPFGLLL